ncbi:MAG: type II toxin-antitoxin system PemK/MazF family toxin [Planctomycetales bacterium]|nr:type II toxin-antitoxin system PemK/MazF family toxin [Planctomycetales bacterium]MBN8624250.1 type II toxin-antitoxin system PemK/MazF family toxin [Planctomycetota bacterium]
MDLVVRRFDVFLVALDPTLGAEIKKTRPCLVISPDEMNERLRNIIIAPMTTHGKAYPSRISCRFKNKAGFVVLDQIRTVDKIRLVKRLGQIDAATAQTVISRLQMIFGP